jgi:multidrug efflux pump subunit AcrA (membrane-fusion protein)
MGSHTLRLPKIPLRPIGWTAALLVVVLTVAFHGTWWPTARQWVVDMIAARRPAVTAEEPAEDHDATSLALSDAGLRNLGLTPDMIRPVELTTWQRSITLPAVVAERPGQTKIHVATPMTGVVLHVHAIPGEAVESGTLLFLIRLTHEDLVQSQTGFLRTLGDLDVERREIARLTEATRTGAVPKIRLLERQYARDKLEALYGAQREALKLHGLSDKQVEQIVSERRLLSELQVMAPEKDAHPENELRLARQVMRPASFRSQAAPLPDQPHAEDEEHHVPLIVGDLRVHKGQAVTAGETLCKLSDYSELFIEGLAFEHDAEAIAAAARRGWTATGIVGDSGSSQKELAGLSIVRLANEIDLESRTLKFFVRLPNHMVSDATDADGRRFVGWRFRPGQRMQLRIPVEEVPDQIVLPIDAVTKEGVEFYVFQQNGDHFDRVAVHVLYRDQHSVVIANDGAIFPGDVLAMRGAHQMQMALRNKASGGTSAHRGHTH